MTPILMTPDISAARFPTAREYSFLIHILMYPFLLPTAWLALRYSLTQRPEPLQLILPLRPTRTALLKTLGPSVETQTWSIRESSESRTRTGSELNLLRRGRTTEYGSAVCCSESPIPSPTRILSPLPITGHQALSVRSCLRNPFLSRCLMRTAGTTLILRSV